MSDEKKVTKFEQNEIEKIQKFRTDYAEITGKLGEVEIELININRQLDALNEFKTNLKNSYFKLREDETKLAEELRNKYGEGEFNIETGEFTPR